MAVDLGNDPIALLQIVHPRTRPTRTAAGGFDDHHPAHLAIFKHSLGAKEPFIKPSHETDLQLHARSSNRVIDRLALGDRQSHRLLKKDVLTPLSRETGYFPM